MDEVRLGTVGSGEIVHHVFDDPELRNVVLEVVNGR